METIVPEWGEGWRPRKMTRVWAAGLRRTLGLARGCISLSLVWATSQCWASQLCIVFYPQGLQKSQCIVVSKAYLWLPLDAFSLSSFLNTGLPYTSGNQAFWGAVPEETWKRVQEGQEDRGRSWAKPWAPQVSILSLMLWGALGSWWPRVVPP